MGGKRKQELRISSSDHLALPDEVVAGTILWRLPVKSILQCRCVCKSWNSLITSSNFVSTHLRKTLTTNPQIFMCQFYIANKTGTCLLSFERKSLHLSLPIPPPDPFDTFRFISIDIIGSVKGLISSVVFVNGRFHWLADEANSLFIMVFDLKDETIAGMFGEFGESSIAIIQLEVYMLDQSHIWIMKEYGSAESWMKLAAISEYVLGFVNEDVLVRKIGCIGLRNINNNNNKSINQLEKVKNINDLLDKILLLPINVYKYVPSLVLLVQSNVYLN